MQTCEGSIPPIWNLAILLSLHAGSDSTGDERQFKTAKRAQAPGDATVRKRFFRGNFFIFRRRSKRIAFLESMNFSTCAYMQLFNFRDVT